MQCHILLVWIDEETTLKAARNKMSPAAVARYSSVHCSSHNPKEYNLPGSRGKRAIIYFKNKQKQN